MEVVIITSLIGLMSVMLLPVFENSRNTAKYAICTMNLKQIYHGLATESTHRGDGFMPEDPFKWEVYAEALVESEVMICPIPDDGHFKTDPSFVFLPEPPESMMQGELEHDSKVYVFREQASFVLTEGEDVIANVGRYGRDFNGGGACDYTPDSEIPQDTLVDVYYFSYDPKTTDNQGHEGEIGFGDYDHIVLGAIGLTNDLNDSDGRLGIAGMNYPDDIGCRGMSHCGGGNFADSIEITENRRKIVHQFSHAGLSCKDDFRVITKPGAGSTYAMNVEVMKNPTRDFQILLADAAVPWINFTNGTDRNTDSTKEFTYEETFEARHFGKVNVMLVDGTVELMEPEDLTPDNDFWRP